MRAPHSPLISDHSSRFVATKQIKRRRRAITTRQSANRRSLKRFCPERTNLYRCAEALCLLLPLIAIVGMILIAIASPAIALIEYDQQNEQTPQLTPEGLKLFAVYFGAFVTVALASATLAPIFHRRQVEHAFMHGRTPTTSYAESYHKHQSNKKRPQAWHRAWIKTAC